MQIVIDIPKEEYEKAASINGAEIKPEQIKDWEYVIAHGTPLPKGHGRLIDADDYLEREKPRGISEDTWHESHLYVSITNADTIIESEE